MLRSLLMEPSLQVCAHSITLTFPVMPHCVGSGQKHVRLGVFAPTIESALHYTYQFIVAYSKFTSFRVVDPHSGCYSIFLTKTIT